MPALYILKIGTCFPEIVQQHGDFDAWVTRGLALQRLEVIVVDAQHGAPLPDPARCAGVVITGSHDMVTERRPWNVQLERWLPQVLTVGVPLLGICYGHQLLAQAMGGTVAYHPRGVEAGTVGIDLLPASRHDPLFSALPQHFEAHVIHAQTVCRLPPGAVCLAANAHEANHAFRLGQRAWGVQFHPEYDQAIMRGYLLACAHDRTAARRDWQLLQQSVAATPAAARLLRRFGRLVETGVVAGF